MSLKGSCEKPVREGNRNSNREVWESPSFHGGEEVKISQMATYSTIILKDGSLKNS
jgi:hypothetical protein